jgi:hypothetical protein
VRINRSCLFGDLTLGRPFGISNRGSISVGRPPGWIESSLPGSGSCILDLFSAVKPKADVFVEGYHVPPAVSLRSKTRIRSK